MGGGGTLVPMPDPTAPPPGAPRDFVAWNGERYPWPPPEGWFLATDGCWWPPRPGDEPAPERPRVPPVSPSGRAEPTLSAPAASDHDERPLPQLAPDPRRWRKRLPLIGIALFLVAVGTYVALAATGRLDGAPEPITATSLPARAIDAPPVFREVAPLTERTVSTAAGTSLDPHAPGDLIELGDETPASTAFQASVAGVVSVEPSAFDAIASDERCIAVVLEIRSELGPPDTAILRFPRVEVVLGGEARPATATCGDPDAVAADLDAVWAIDAAPSAEWQRLVDFAVVPRSGGAPAIALDGELVAAAPLVVSLEDDGALPGVADREITILSAEPDGIDCVTVRGEVTVPFAGQGVVDAEVADVVGVDTVAGLAGVSTCGTGPEERGDLLRLPGGATAPWRLSFEVEDGLDFTALLDGVPVD